MIISEGRAELARLSSTRGDGGQQGGNSECAVGLVRGREAGLSGDGESIQSKLLEAYSRLAQCQVLIAGG